MAATAVRYSPLAFRAFDLLFRPWRASRLLTAPITGLPASLPADRPLVLVANHTSWWDGFLLRDVHTALRPRGPMYSVMTEAELRPRPFLRLLGAVPLDPGSAMSLLRLLRGLHGAAQARPDCTILFFPQGRIWPAWKRPLGFQDGVEVLIRAVAPCVVLPVALHVESLQRSSPMAFIRAGQPIDTQGETVTAELLEAAVTEQLDQLAALIGQHGEATLQHMNEVVETA